MTEEDKAAARALALDVIRDYRDRGCPEPAPVDAGLLQRDDGLAGLRGRAGRVRPDAARGDGARRRRRTRHGASRPTPRRAPPSRCVVIGCGKSGLLAGIRLQEAGIPFTIIEKNAGVGGTWWENTYPGARVDVGNHFYCYSFEPSDHWTEFFAQQPELQAYFEGVMERHGIDRARPVRHRGARRDVGRRRRPRGRCDVDGADGTEETLTARAVISAVGQLNRPNLPDFAGAETFAGPAFHSARWDHDVDTGRQARRDDRRRRERLPDRARDRRRGRTPHRVPAHRAVDVPEPQLPRAGRTGRAVGAAPPAVLRRAGTGS